MKTVKKTVHERRGRVIAKRLFRLMPQFDRFDIVLMHLDSVLAVITPDDVKYVVRHYDLTELHNKLRKYAHECEMLAKRIRELTSEELNM